MKNKPQLGLHISTSDKLENFQMFGAIQIFAGSPQTFQVGQKAIDFVNKYNKDFNIIIHCPYIINLVNTKHKMYPKTISFSKEIAEKFAGKIYGYVTHIGLIYTKAELKSKLNESVEFGNSSLKHTIDTLLPIFEQNKIKLLFENTHGNEYGSDISNLENMFSLINEYKSDYFKLCWDSNHSYGNGELTIKDIEQLNLHKNEIGAIHLNSIGKGEFGEHKDFHADCALNECTKFQFDDYKKFYNTFQGLPMILERDYDKGMIDFNMLTKS
jgi:endonuclease IV